MKCLHCLEDTHDLFDCPIPMTHESYRKTMDRIAAQGDIRKTVQWLGSKSIQTMHDEFGLALVNWGPGDNGEVMYVVTPQGNVVVQPGHWVHRDQFGQFWAWGEQRKAERRTSERRQVQDTFNYNRKAGEDI